jgi:flagellar motor protein MotB
MDNNTEKSKLPAPLPEESVEFEPPEIHHFSAEESAPNNDWMLTFANLFALLLAFFIVEYSMSTMQPDQWHKVAHAMNKTFNAPRFIDQLMHSSPTSPQSLKINAPISLDYLHTVISQTVEKDPFMKETLHIENTNDALTISLPSSAVFEMGKDTLTLESRVIFFTLGETLKPVGNKVDIVGYTSGRRPKKGKDHEKDQALYTAWELALARAMIVGGELQKFRNVPVAETYVQYSQEVVEDETADSNTNETAVALIPERVDIIIRKQPSYNEH